METMEEIETRRLYSWWWDSHISPKNSKWLQENLTDMDAKVKAMIKLIEEDADSFARRAEMYYKKRPELMKLVEEFYRAYRALAERYDHATGALRQAQRTMAEVFPNQVPFALPDDSPSGSSASEVGPRTPDISHPIRAMFEPDHMNKDEMGLSSSKIRAFSEEGKVRKSLNFHDEDRKSSDGNLIYGDQAETRIQSLTEALAKLEAETEANLLQYRQCLEKLSNMEAEVFHAQETSRGLDERASKADIEIQTLKQSLAKLESEKEAGLVQYKQCLERISGLEMKISRAEEDNDGLNARANKAETEAQTLKEALTISESEKEACIVRYNQCLEMISNLESEISRAEEEARRSNERAVKAETSVQSLQEIIDKLHDEKENAALRYQICLNKIANLETELFRARDEVRNLNSEIEQRVAKLNSSEEQKLLLERANQSLQSELQKVAEKTEIQRQKLENGLVMLRDVELWNQNLENELHHVKEENIKLNEQNSSSTISMKNMQEEIYRMKKMTEKLEEESKLRFDQRNVLQQEIYHLKREIEDLGRRYQGLIDQVDSVGLNPDFLGSSVKDLQVENSNLKQNIEMDKGIKVALMEKLAKMENLLEKNVLLESSLSDLNLELEELRMKVKALEGSCLSLQEEKLSLLDEKSTLVSQLEIVTEKMEKLLEKNLLLENSISDSNVELEGLRKNSNSLEESYRFLDNEKSGLIAERNDLLSSLKGIQERLEMLEKKYEELEEKYSQLESEEKTFTTQQVQELWAFFDIEKQEHADFVQSSETRLARLEDQIVHVQEQGHSRKKDFEEDLEKAIEIFILEKSIQDMEEKNFSLMIECQTYFETSKVTERLISELEQECFEQHVESNYLLNELEYLGMGLDRILKSLEIELDYETKDGKMVLQYILDKIEEKDSSLITSQDENQKLVFENSVLSTLLERLSTEARHIQSSMKDEIGSLMKECLRLKNEKHILEEENGVILAEVIALGNLSLVSKTYCAQRGAEIEGLSKDLDRLHDAKKELEKEAVRMGKKFENVEAENFELKGLVVKLEHELNEVKNVNDQLKYLLEKEKDTTRQMEIELSQAEQKLKETRAETEELVRDIKSLKRENDESRMRREELEKQNLKHLEVNSNQNKEIRFLRGLREKSESEIAKLHEEIKDCKFREEKLSSELQNEVEIHEAEASTLYSDLQMAIISSVLFEQKVHEIVQKCESLEDENTSKQAEIEQLKEILKGFECENEASNSKLLSKITKSYQETNEERNHGVSGLQELQVRVKSVEKALMKMEKLTKLETLDVRTRVEVALEEIEELKSKNSIVQEEEFDVSAKLQMYELGHDPEISEMGDGISMKDILLDQISECSSSFDHRFGSQGISKRENDELGFWETTDNDFSTESKINKREKMKQPATREHSHYRQSKNPESELQTEKELGVDKLGISKRITEQNQEANKRKLSVQLASDAQKLTNLQLTIEDLRKKVEKSKKNKKSMFIEYNNVMEQLQLVEETLLQLVDINGKLTRSFEGSPLSSSRRVLKDFEESKKVQRRRVLEQAREGSERIGKLQLEVQKVQFVLLKLEDDNAAKGISVAKKNKAILLRDYIKRGVRGSNQGRKKTPCCACVRKPETNEE